jgi:hypothetical protein
MRTTHAFVACLTTLLAAAPLVLTQCSGTSGGTKVTAGTDGGNHGSSGGGGGSGGGSSGGNESSSGGGGDDAETGSSGGQGTSSGGIGGDGGETGDGGGASSSGGTVVQVPEGGAPSQPGMVSCGGTTCETSSSQCCLGADGGTCTAFNAGCSSGVTQPCDEAADCINAVCCQPLECGQHSTTCKTTCGTTDFQLCRTDSECGQGTDAGAAKKCIVQTCGTQMFGAACGGTMVTVEACAYPGAGGFGSVTYGPLPECTAN